MIRKLFFSASLFLWFSAFPQTGDEVFLRKIADEILVNGKAYDHLRVLTKTIGGRLAGSPQMYKAENWGYQILRECGSTNTFKQAAMVPHWVRGGTDEAVAILPGNKKKNLNCITLGNSMGTGGRTIIADVVLINNFDELDAKKDGLKGKIVFYNYKFNPKLIRVFEAYGDAVKYRGQGPSRAAKYGAIGVLVRSMSESTDNVPHTGATRYDSMYAKIPAVALGLKDADWLAGELSKGSNIMASIKTNGRFLPDVEGHNIIGELKGSGQPEEFITVGGHLDSWDNCEGAHDDGAGIVQTAEILRAFTALGYKPKHTIRFVFFANEENGGRGGNQYADVAISKNEKHIFALESDAGGFTPRGFSVTCSKEQLEKLKSWEKLLKPYGAGEIDTGGGGADVTPLNQKMGVPMGELLPDSQRYFDMHHSRNDVFEIVNKRELELGAVNMAGLIYLIDQYGL